MQEKHGERSLVPDLGALDTQKDLNVKVSSAHMGDKMFPTYDDLNQLRLLLSLYFRQCFCKAYSVSNQDSFQGGASS